MQADTLQIADQEFRVSAALVQPAFTMSTQWQPVSCASCMLIRVNWTERPVMLLCTALTIFV